MPKEPKNELVADTGRNLEVRLRGLSEPQRGELKVGLCETQRDDRRRQRGLQHPGCVLWVHGTGTWMGCL